MRPSENLPLPPRIYPLFQPLYMCDPPRIYSSNQEYTLIFNKFICATLPESPPPPPKIPSIPPIFNKFIYATLLESTPPSKNIRPFSTNLCVRPSQNLPLTPRIPPFSTNLYVRPSYNLPLLPRIYPPFQPIYVCDPPRIYPSLPEYTPILNKFICATLPESTPEHTPFSIKIFIYRGLYNSRS